MCEDNLQRARAMAEAVDEHAGVCAVSEAEVLALSGALRPAHEHAHSHPHGQAQHPHPAVAKGGLQ